MPEDGFWMDLFLEGNIKCAYYLSPVCKKWFKEKDGYRSSSGLVYCCPECYHHLETELKVSGKLRSVREEGGLEES